MSYTEDRAAWFQGQGLWQQTPASDWHDWTWQLKNRLTTAEQLERLLVVPLVPGHPPMQFPYNLKIQLTGGALTVQVKQNKLRGQALRDWVVV